MPMYTNILDNQAIKLVCTLDVAHAVMSEQSKHKSQPPSEYIEHQHMVPDNINNNDNYINLLVNL